MFTKFKIKPIVSSLIIVLLMSNQTLLALQFTDIGKSSGSTYEYFDGQTHYGQAGFDQPYGLIYWYVRGPGETGYGTVATIDHGDGISTTSYFSHTFNGGSKEGTEYTITAYAYPTSPDQDMRIVEQSYTVTIYDRDAIIDELERIEDDLEDLMDNIQSLSDELDDYEPVGSEVFVIDEIKQGLWGLLKGAGSALGLCASLTGAAASGGTLTPVAIAGATVSLSVYVASMDESYRGFRDAFRA